jgi:hypothetical protein
MTASSFVRPLHWLLADGSLAAHLARGAAGFGAVALALAAPWTTAWPALILLALALVMLRGCPTCWLFGTACAIQGRYPPKPRQGD